MKISISLDLRWHLRQRLSSKSHGCAHAWPKAAPWGALGGQNSKMHQKFQTHLTFLLFRAEKKHAGQLRSSGTSPFVCARFRSRQANASCSNTGLKWHVWQTEHKLIKSCTPHTTEKSMPVCPGIFKQGVPRFARDRRLFKPEGSRDRRGGGLVGVSRANVWGVVSSLVWSRQSK